MKHCISIEDINKTDVENILNIYDKLKNMPEKERLELCRGKILAALFFKESVRSMGIVKSSILKLGGNYIALPPVVTEDEEDVVKSLAPFCDWVAIRSDNANLESLTHKINVPIINALCKGTEHSLSAIWQLVALHAFGKNLNGLRVGIYGQTAHCRPYLSLQKALSLFGVQVYHDAVMPELANPETVTNYIRANGGTYTLDKLENFIDKIDVLLIPDGMPMGGYEITPVFEEYATKFNVVDSALVQNLPQTALINYMLPRMLVNNQFTVQRDFADSRLYNDKLMAESVWATMALLIYLGGIQI